MRIDLATPALRGSHQRRRWIAWLAILFAPMIITIVSLLLIQQLTATNKLAAARENSEERRMTIMAVLSAHKDIEAGQRGYLLAGKESFLDPYRSGLIEIDETLDQLSRQFRNDNDQLVELSTVERISREKREFAAKTIRLGRAGDMEGARRFVVLGEGKRLMDELREHLNSMLNAEVSRLSTTSRQAEQATRTLRYATFGLLAALLVLLFAAAVAINRMWDERRKAMILIEDTSRRRAAILDSAMDAILILNPSGSIESANAAASRMFGYSEDEMISRDVGMLFAEVPIIGRVAQVLREMDLQERSPGALQEIVGRRNDGHIFPTDVAVTVAPLAEGVRYVAVIRDITERKRMDQMKSEFVSTVSHELRTPLTSIAGSLGLLAGGAVGELGDRAGRLITIAHNNANRLVRLINDILDIEKLESGKMPFNNQRIELQTVIAQAIEENRGFAQTYGASIKLVADDEPASAFADPDRLVQVLTNLLSNAVKFSPAGGTVKVTLAPGKSRHRITVADEGAGIPEEFRQRIFGKFAQADSSDSRAKGGTGLGLSIVREITVRLGGSISFDSHEGEGTQFHIHLPALEAGPLDLPRQHQILLCAEEELPSLYNLLSATNYKVRIARDAAEAVIAIDSEKHDAVLIDMGLTQAGIPDIIRHVRRSVYNENTPVVVVTSEQESEDYISDPALMVDWLYKPVELTSIGQRIDAAILRTNGKRPRVLHVDDDPDILRVVATALADKAVVTSAKSLMEAREAIAQQDFDLAILDLTLPDGRGPELLESLREGNGRTPIVIFSAEDADSESVGQFEAFLTKARMPMQQLVEIVEREARANRKDDEK